MKDIFSKSYLDYYNYMDSILPNYDHSVRRTQAQTIIYAINDRFNFDKLITVETGASQNPLDGVFGLFLGFATQRTNGKFMSVDINREILNRNEELFKNVLPNLDHRGFNDDSVNFLTNLTEIPNMVHLDSWDLDLKNPFPSALHGWEEFKAIESKMPSGSLIIIDDNYRNGTYIDWIYPDGKIERIINEYPMIGKGAHIYNHVINGNSDWELIGNHYDSFICLKIIIQKK